MKPNAILLIIAIIIFLMGTFTGCLIERKFIAEPCAELIKSDTVTKIIYGDTSLKLAVIDTAPKPTETKPSKKKAQVKKQIAEIKQKIDTANVDSGCVELKAVIDSLSSLCDSLVCLLPDTNKYDSTLVADSIRTHYKLEVEGKLLSIRIWNANLKPNYETTITNTVEKKKQWVVYGCVQLPVSKNYISVIPTVNITTPVGFSFGYGYEPRRNEHLPQIGYAVKFNQK